MKNFANQVYASIALDAGTVCGKKILKLCFALFIFRFKTIPGYVYDNGWREDT